MPNTARWAATGTLMTAALCGPLTGSALAAPAPAPALDAPATASSGLYAPSALVLTVGRGTRATSAVPERAVTLSCAPTAIGTHPAAERACAELTLAAGDFDALPAAGPGPCTRQYDPVVVTVEGVWRGHRVTYERTFGNECVKNAQESAFFTF
ncbi:subtilase-type protease inhibitor [Streptomyces sp. NPDC058001]|uniref:subtilase-type protease inhibitor n=1 Tax=Streptomyces sp. NPDC058001 TaxID=3346300 RepID=UPI0036E1DAA6